MRVGVGYSENPDTNQAGIQAARMALSQVDRNRSCDLALMFSTSRHDADILIGSVTSVLGSTVKIVGGGAVGVITNDFFGYAGDQIGIAAIWFDGAPHDIIIEGGLAEGEEDVGIRVGKRLAATGIDAESVVMIFYDAIHRTAESMRLLMATPLLQGLEKGLGVMPHLLGAGLQGDYSCTPISQWTGNDLAQHHAIALTFGGGIRVDSAVMHGCHPITSYYTVTKAENQTILEINNQPALTFLDDLLSTAITPEEYAFFLILGINRGDQWGEFDENNYASRLCLGIDRERNGIVMFEPDMVAGTRFQIMHRGLDLNYMKPRIDALFANLDDRTPVFSLYIDCAGRAAGYAGLDFEDALVVQETTRGKTPLLGIYSGVEIAPVAGRSRALDWTGVFCLFSVPK